MTTINGNKNSPFNYPNLPAGESSSTTFAAEQGVVQTDLDSLNRDRQALENLNSTQYSTPAQARQATQSAAQLQSDAAKFQSDQQALLQIAAQDDNTDEASLASGIADTANHMITGAATIVDTDVKVVNAFGGGINVSSRVSLTNGGSSPTSAANSTITISSNAAGAVTTASVTDNVDVTTPTGNAVSEAVQLNVPVDANGTPVTTSRVQTQATVAYSTAHGTSTQTVALTLTVGPGGASASSAVLGGSGSATNSTASGSTRAAADSTNASPVSSSASSTPTTTRSAPSMTFVRVPRSMPSKPTSGSSNVSASSATVADSTHGSTAVSSTSKNQPSSATVTQASSGTVTQTSSATQVSSATVTQTSSATQVSSATVAQVSSATGSRVSSTTVTQISSATGSQVPSTTVTQVSSATGTQVSTGSDGQVSTSSGQQVSTGSGNQVSTGSGSQVSTGSGSQVSSGSGGQVSSGSGSVSSALGASTPITGAPVGNAVSGAVITAQSTPYVFGNLPASTNVSVSYSAQFATVQRDLTTLNSDEAALNQLQAVPGNVSPSQAASALSLATKLNGDAQQFSDDESTLLQVAVRDQSIGEAQAAITAYGNPAVGTINGGAGVLVNLEKQKALDNAAGGQTSPMVASMHSAVDSAINWANQVIRQDTYSVNGSTAAGPGILPQPWAASQATST